MTGRVLAFVSAALAAVVLAASASANEPAASLGGFVCRPASNPLNRVVSITSTMRPLAGTQSMRLRFVLLQRIPGQVAHPVRGGDLGRWHQAPSETWVFRKLVVNLPAPAFYRFRVSFVWLGPGGGVIGSQTLLGPRCYQPG